MDIAALLNPVDEVNSDDKAYPIPPEAEVYNVLQALIRRQYSNRLTRDERLQCKFYSELLYTPEEIAALIHWSIR